MGSNAEGKLGFAKEKAPKVMIPKLLESLLGPQIVDIACGDNHTVAVTSSGECFSWGNGHYGALGLGG